MSKLTYDEVLEALADERRVDPANVRADVLRRHVWLMMYSAPGCLPDHSETHRTRSDALDSARELYGDDAPRGFITDLRRTGISATDENGYYRVEVTRVRISELF